MNIIENELIKFNKILYEVLEESENEINPDILDFIFSKSKKLRPKLLILFAKALEKEITPEIYYLACAVELLHNSTLIHDDIIDEAQMRRGKISLNKKLGNNLSVLAGDYILSCALKCLTKCNDINIINIFSQSLKNMCEGEINQYFTKNKILSLYEYINKSINKTAELFRASLISLIYILNLKNHTKEIDDFAITFGTAFQIKDDYLNIYCSDNTKPQLIDIYNGIYTAPVIYLNQKITDIENLPKAEIIEKIKNDSEIHEKTINLIKKYCDKSIASIEFIKDNQYKKEIIKITENLHKAEVNE